MKHNKILGLVIIILVLGSFRSLYGQSWDFVQNRNGIMFYTRDEPGTGFKSFKGVVDVRTTVERVSHYIGNIQNFDWWDEDITEIKVLLFEKEKLIRYYLVYDIPWPFSDRDLCVEAQIRTDPITGIRTVRAKPLPDVMPENADRVRIRNYWQTWTIQPLGDGMVRLILEGYVDPGGIIPSWLYNMVITNAPLKQMEEIVKRVEMK